MKVSIPGLLAFAVIACSSGGSGPTDNSPIDSNPNNHPTAEFTFAPVRPHEGEIVSFDATASLDPDGSIQSFTWSFGDGTSDSGPRVSHAYASAGSRSVVLTIMDDDGAAATASGVVDVQPPNMAPDVSFTFRPSSPELGQPVIFDGSSSVDPDGGIQQFAWVFGDAQVPSRGPSPTATHIYDEQGTFMAKLTVTDDDRATSATTRAVTIGPPSTISFAPIAGEWEGIGEEPATGDVFRIRASIQSSAVRGEVIGTVVYDNDVCRGDWRAAEEDGMTYVVREIITQGMSLCPNGVVTLVHDVEENTLDYEFIPDLGPLNAEGSLSPER